MRRLNLHSLGRATSASRVIVVVLRPFSGLIAPDALWKLSLYAPCCSANCLYWLDKLYHWANNRRAVQEDGHRTPKHRKILYQDRRSRSSLCGAVSNRSLREFTVVLWELRNMAAAVVAALEIDNDTKDDSVRMAGDKVAVQNATCRPRASQRYQHRGCITWP